MTVVVAGQQITDEEAKGLVRMLYEDARQIAGTFHTMNRSAKFRANWPDEYLFADANWKSFVEAARAMYAERLGDPKTKPEDARKMHLALVLQAVMGQAKEKDNRLQLAPGSQQYEGDRKENARIVEKFGTRQNLRAALMNSVATRH